MSKPTRILFISNPDEDGSDSDSRPHPFAIAENSFQPHIQLSPRSTKQSLPLHVPPPLTTNLPSERHNHYQRSNPTLSSPSTSSSPAGESTPPPSTPGLTVPPVDIAGDGDGTLKPEPMVAASTNDREATPTRVANIIEKVKSRLPHRSAGQVKRPVRSPVLSIPASHAHEYSSQISVPTPLCPCLVARAGLIRSLSWSQQTRNDTLQLISQVLEALP